jgi:DNA-binding transcriptional LysR family regulator
VLLEEARRIFIRLEQTARMVERVGSGKVGRLSLGFVPSATNEVLPPVLYWIPVCAPARARTTNTVPTPCTHLSHRGSCVAF